MKSKISKNQKSLLIRVSLNLFILAQLHRKSMAYLKRSRVRFLGLEPVLGVNGGKLKNAPTVGIEPLTSPIAKRTPYPLHYCDLIRVVYACVEDNYIVQFSFAKQNY